jgi:hypothetical protein
MNKDNIFMVVIGFNDNKPTTSAISYQQFVAKLGRFVAKKHKFEVRTIF